jgi:hypothetical protein
LESAQYLGSAAQGLGFLHVDVVDEGNKSGYMKFLENCTILSIEEGYIEEEEIVEGLQKLFDQNWQWQLKGIGDFRYLVRFPPHKQVATTLISDITYFKLHKEGVLVSLSADPYDALDDVWVQISGIPPKWSDWRTLRQVSSSLGKLLEVD